MLQALSASSDKEWKKIIAISRRPPVLDHDDSRIVFESVDLLAPKDEVVQKLRHAGAAEATHTFFYAYIAKEDEQDLIDVNRKLFGNVRPSDSSPAQTDWSLVCAGHGSRRRGRQADEGFPASDGIQVLRHAQGR